jgi:hypothetical protein
MVESRGALRWRAWALPLACGAAVVAFGAGSPSATARSLLWALALAGPVTGAGVPDRRAAWVALGTAPGIAILVCLAGAAHPLESCRAALPSALGLLVWGGGALAFGAALGVRRAWLGTAALVTFLLLDPLSSRVHGDAGYFLDAVRPGRAISWLSTGALDLRALLTLGLAPAAAWAALVWSRAPLGDAEARTNGSVRMVLAPLAVATTLAAAWPHPIFVELDRDDVLSSEEALARTLGVPDGTVLFEIFAGGPVPAPLREDLRALRDTLRGIDRVGAAPVAVEWLDPAANEEDAKLAGALGIAPRDGVWAALALRNLEDVQVLREIPSRRMQEQVLGRLFGQLSAHAATPTLWVLGADAALADAVPGVLATPLTDAHLLASIARGQLGEDTRVEAVVLLDPREELSPERRYLLDQYAMAGGSLGFFVGDLPGPLRPLLSPWGVAYSEEGAPASTARLAEDLTLGEREVLIPAGVRYVDGPAGLLRPGIADDHGSVLVRVRGTVPSGVAGHPPPAGLAETRAQSLGTMRALVGSARLLEQDATLLTDLVDWLLDRPSTPRVRPSRERTPAGRLRARGAGLLVALLLGALVGAPRERRP